MSAPDLRSVSSDEIEIHGTIQKNSTTSVPSECAKNSIFALLPNYEPDVIEKDKQRLASLAAKRKEEEEKEVKYKADAANRKKLEEKEARKQARLERERQIQEAAQKADRDRKMLMLIVARRDAEAKGEPFDEEKYLLELKAQEDAKQQEILEKKNHMPKKLHVKEIMAIVEGKPVSKADIDSADGMNEGNSKEDNRDKESPKGGPDTFLVPQPKPKKPRDVTAITAEQRAQARRALVRQTFEAARRKGKSAENLASSTSETDDQIWREVNKSLGLVSGEDGDLGNSDDRTALENERMHIERALEIARKHAQNHQMDEDAALTVAMALLDRLAPDGTSTPDNSGSPNTSPELTDPPASTSTTIPNSPSRLSASPKQPGTPSRTKNKRTKNHRDPLQTALAVAKRMAMKEDRYFNEQEFINFWLAEQGAAGNSIDPSPYRTDTSTDAGNNAGPNTVGEPEDAANKPPPTPPTQSKPKDSPVTDKMKLAMIAAKRQAIENGQPWDEEKFKREYKEDIPDRTPDRKSLTRQSAAEREQKMKALASHMSQINDSDPVTSPSAAARRLLSAGASNPNEASPPKKPPTKSVLKKWLTGELAAEIEAALKETTEGLPEVDTTPEEDEEYYTGVKNIVEKFQRKFGIMPMESHARTKSIEDLSNVDVSAPAPPLASAAASVTSSEDEVENPTASLPSSEANGDTGAVVSSEAAEETA